MERLYISSVFPLTVKLLRERRKRAVAKRERLRARRKAAAAAAAAALLEGDAMVDVLDAPDLLSPNCRVPETSMSSARGGREVRIDREATP
jgi:hypothetical protein